MRPRQKFYESDLVRVADDLGPSMSRFDSGCEAIVVGSELHETHYTDRIEEHHEYTIMLDYGNIVSWYQEDQLSLVKERQTDLYNKWMDNDWLDNQE